MSAQYRTCPLCGDHIDHGEICDCRRQAAEAETADDIGGAEDIQQPSYEQRAAI